MREKLILGAVVVYPAILRQFLIKSHYFMNYDNQTEKLTLSVNHGFGGQPIFEFRSVSPESAHRLAGELGLEKTGENSWGKWNPILDLKHDGSDDAEMVRLEMLKLGIPHNVTGSQEHLALGDGQVEYKYPSYDTKGLIDIVRKTAERYQSQLTSRP